MLPESAWAADVVPAPVKASKATRAERNPDENRMVESPWNRGRGKSSTPGGLGTMKPRPARGAIWPGGQPGEQKHEQCDEQDDVHFFPRLSSDRQTCGRRVGFRGREASSWKFSVAWERKADDLVCVRAAEWWASAGGITGDTSRRKGG